MCTIIVFACLGLQVKWNQFSSNNFHHTSCIHKGCMLGSDLTQLPLNQILSVHWDTTGQTTLEDHWSHMYTGMPLEAHWMMLAPFRWCSSGDPVLICITGTHWNTTGRPPEAHWKHTGYKQCCLQWHSSMPWCLSSRHTGLPSEWHWITTGSG